MGQKARLNEKTDRLQPGGCTEHHQGHEARHEAGAPLATLQSNEMEEKMRGG